MRKWKVGNLGFFLLFDSKPTFFLSQNTNYEIRLDLSVENISFHGEMET